MNILLVQEDCSIGGHTFLRLENAKGLTERGHSVTCFFFNDMGCLDLFARVCRTLQGDAGDLRRLVRETYFDVAHGDATMLDLPPILRAARFGGRIVLTRHAVDSPVGWLTRHCQGYIAESPTSLALMQPYTDLPVAVVPNGIDTSVFRPVACDAPVRPIIAWCGRSGAAFKNLPLYLEITQCMACDNYEFWVADGDDLPSPDWKSPFSATSHIASWRRYKRSEFPLFYSRIAASGGCLLGTSLHEGLPLTILEALACGCPVVAMDSRGVNDVMTGDLSQWLFPNAMRAPEIAPFVMASLARLGTNGVREGLREHVIRNFSVGVMVAGNLREYARPLPELAHRAATADRSAISAHLWRHARRTLADGGRVRDALFAMRSAAKLAPRSLLSPAHARLLLQAGNRSRLNGARVCADRAGIAFQRRRFAAGCREMLRAARIHPAVLLGRR